MQKEKEKFSRYEVARIIGARALQIAMDAPLILKISDEKLKEVRFDPLRISELEFNSGVLPISIDRPTPRKHREKILAVKEEKISDEEIVAKEQEVEKEIVENAEEFALVKDDEEEDLTPTAVVEEQ